MSDIPRCTAENQEDLITQIRGWGGQREEAASISKERYNYLLG